jgi:adenine-specific DNA-methyltransferase
MTSKITDLTLNLNRKRELQNDDLYIHIMKYMGSKRELLPNIKNVVSDMIKPDDVILDIFAGTASVGAYLKNDYTIYSNDIQSYSQIIANSLIASSSIKLPFDMHVMIFNIEKEFIKNKEVLLKSLSKTLFESERFVAIKKGQWNDALRQEYLDFFNTFPSPLNGFKTNNKELQKLKDNYFSMNKSRKLKLPYFQTTFLFAETYFSLEQTIDIDSIRYAIDKVVDDDLLKSIFLSALIYAHSYCSSGTGHFAMFRDIADVSAIEDIFIYRSKRIWDFFIRKLDELILYHEYMPNKKHQTFSKDYKQLLLDESMKNVDLIYADPPYSFVHYSRFYHAVESLVKYDYDIPMFKGRYRTDRHQSPFCQQTNVEKAFDNLFKGAMSNNANVLLSYSDTGMISLEKIREIIMNKGFTFEAEGIVYNHSTLGRKGHKNNKIQEYLVKAIIR